MTSYQPRELTPRLLRALRHLPIIVLSGLRQVGKSTLLQREQPLVEGHAYRTLDDFATLAAARANPEALLAEAVILDEVQRCPELLLALKGCVDRDRRPGQRLPRKTEGTGPGSGDQDHRCGVRPGSGGAGAIFH